jgi:hypothetical protein
MEQDIKEGQRATLKNIVSYLAKIFNAYRIFDALLSKD